MAIHIRMIQCIDSLFAPPTQAWEKQAFPDPLPRPPVLAREAMFLFLRRPEELSAEEQETLTLLRSLHSEVDQAYGLVQQFAEDWFAGAPASSLMIGSAA